MTSIEPYIYTFEELPILPGLLASGKAELVSAGEGYEGEFYVRGISIDADAWLPTDRYSLSYIIHQSIAKIIQDDKTTHGKHAAEEWAEHEKEYK